MSAAADHNPIVRGGSYALLAALAFGLTTPIIQKFGSGVGPLPSSALLYAGAALASLNFRRVQSKEAPLRATNLRRLLRVAVLGAIVAPVCLTWGLQHTKATSASLLLNFEAVFTVLAAWLCYREPIGRRVGLALLAMLVGGILLVVSNSAVDTAKLGLGACAVVAAAAAWAFDNTLARPLADLDPRQVVRWKGGLGASASLVCGLLLRQPFPGIAATFGLLACGATGYGLSLRLYLLAQRQMGAARTGSMFSIAPFVGAAAAWVMGDRSGNIMTLLASGLFGFGTYLHLTESHQHTHTHTPLEHEHAHRHDDGHHDHHHEPAVTGQHSHVHQHDLRTHDHAHAPDLHHEHDHG